MVTELALRKVFLFNRTASLYVVWQIRPNQALIVIFRLFPKMAHTELDGLNFVFGPYHVYGPGLILALTTHNSIGNLSFVLLPALQT